MKDLDTLSKKYSTASLFVRNLMRKMFTEEYLSTKTLSQMDMNQRTAIIGIHR